MRISIPDRIKKEQDALLPFLEFTQEKGWGPKPDAPKEIFDRYKAMCNEMDKLHREAM